MQTGQGSRLDTLRAIQQFIDDNGVKLSAIVTSGTRRQLDQAVADLSAFAAKQSGATVGGDGAQAAALRDALGGGSHERRLPTFFDDGPLPALANDPDVGAVLLHLVPAV